MRKWKTQWNRVVRYEERLEELMRQVPFNRPAIYFCDDILTFFVECHSIKDWLIEDQDVLRDIGWEAKQDMIDKFVRSDFVLQLCADIANGKKHMVLGKRKQNGPNRGKRRRRYTFVTDLKKGKLPGLSLSIDLVYVDDNSTEFVFDCSPRREATAANHERFAQAWRDSPNHRFKKVFEQILSEVKEDDEATWEDAARYADQRRNNLIKQGFPNDRLFLNICADFVLDGKLLSFEKDDPRRHVFDEGAASFASECIRRWMAFFDKHIPDWNASPATIAKDHRTE